MDGQAAQAAANHFEGTHISAHLAPGGRVSVRNKDNICGATVARGRKMFSSAPLWEAFLGAVNRETPFADAVDFFERRGVRMTVTG